MRLALDPVLWSLWEMKLRKVKRKMEIFERVRKDFVKIPKGGTKLGIYLGLGHLRKTLEKIGSEREEFSKRKRLFPVKKRSRKTIKLKHFFLNLHSYFSRF